MGSAKLTLALALLLCSGAAAQGESRRALAKRHFAQGKRHFLTGSYAAAIRSFQRAYQLRGHRVIQYNIALAYARAGNVIQAVTHLRRYLEQARPTDPPVSFALRRAQRRVGVLVVRGLQPAARIYIDGRFVGAGSAEVVLKPGRATLEIRVGSNVLARKTVRIKAGAERLWRLPDRPSSRSASRAAAPQRGTHQTLQRSGLVTGRRRRRLRFAYFATSAAVTLTALISAAATSARTKALHDEFVADPTNTALRAKGIRYQNAAKALWTVTALAAVTTASLAIFTRWPSLRRERRVLVTPALGPGSAGVTLTWRH